MGDIEVQVLRCINVTIQRGELGVIMVAAGSAESKCENTLGTLEQPTGGSYFLGLFVVILTVQRGDAG
jgi:ABC-type lipoprotein export system ATPase subunit